MNSPRNFDDSPVSKNLGGSTPVSETCLVRRGLGCRGLGQASCLCAVVHMLHSNARRIVPAVLPLLPTAARLRAHSRLVYASFTPCSHPIHTSFTTGFTPRSGGGARAVPRLEADAAAAGLPRRQLQLRHRRHGALRAWAMAWVERVPFRWVSRHEPAGPNGVVNQKACECEQPLTRP